MKSRWSTRSGRRQRDLLKEGTKPGQSVITDFFNLKTVCKFIESNNEIKEKINEQCGRPKQASVSPLLERLYQNANSNMSAKKQGNRHDFVVKQFGISLLILAGKSTYEFIQANLGKYSVFFGIRWSLSFKNNRHFVFLGT